MSSLQLKAAAPLSHPVGTGVVPWRLRGAYSADRCARAGRSAANSSAVRDLALQFRDLDVQSFDLVAHGGEPFIDLFRAELVALAFHGFQAEFAQARIGFRAQRAFLREIGVQMLKISHRPP